jgi:histidyl-tRNA synthetase
MPDMFPADLKKWHFLESTLQKVFSSYNVDEVRTPLLESTDLFSRSAGSSSDIVNKELYTFLDRNDESISLRPEGSASVIRAVIQKKQENEKHKLWYQGPMFRYERPQKGRFRQFHQVGVEYLGFEEGAPEYELIAMVLQIHQSLGIKNFKFKINHLGNADEKKKFCESLVSFLQPHLPKLHQKDVERLKHNPLRILDSKEKSTQTLLQNAPKYVDFISVESKQLLEDLILTYKDQCDIEIDNSLVRGLDYYTGLVFEVTSNNLGAQDAILGGGRYDLLSEQLGGQSLNAIGFAIGIERIIELINIDNLMDPIKVGFIVYGEQIYKKTYKIANNLRKANKDIVLESYLSGGSLKSQLRRANKNNCNFAVIVGDDEITNDQVVWKDLSEDGQQIFLDVEELITKYTNL